MAMKNPGKMFEEDFKNSCPFWIEKEKDNIMFSQNNNTRFTMTSNYDFRIFTGKTLFLLELKSTKQESLPFSAFKKTKSYDQLKELHKNCNYKNTKAGAIINFRSENKTYFIETYELLYLRSSSPRKSISIDDCEAKGKIIPQELKRIRYKYNFTIFGGQNENMFQFADDNNTGIWERVYLSG